MKKCKNLLAVILSLALTVGCLVFPANAAGTEPEAKYGIYCIDSAEELLWAAENPDKNYLLTADIDLSDRPEWEPIGIEGKPFSGSFNGAGHKITLGLEMTETADGIYMAGLFGVVSGTVINLAVDGNIDAVLYSGYVGGIAANLSGGYIIGCESDVDITAETRSGIIHTGGIAGAARSTGGAATIEDCTFNGSLNVKAIDASGGSGDLGRGSRGSTGGILGFICDSTGAYISRCVNNGSITVDGGAQNIGGIAGQTSTDSAPTYADITYCANKGDITVYNTKGERAAGIIGYVKGGVINYCYNTGDIIEYTDSGNTAARSGYGNFYGIFGYANLGDNNRLEVTYCYNASENPLEAEICVVRNASKGTFKNFYMSGREEYELSLNASSVSAGAPGTAFTSASDLLEKITADDSGAAAYSENPDDGYPVLFFEVPTPLDIEPNSGAVIAQNVSGYSHNLYVVFQLEMPVDEQVDLITSIKNGDEVVESTPLAACDSFKAEGITYVAADGCKLYAVCLNSVSDDIWDSVQINAVKDGENLHTVTLPQEDIISSSGISLPFEGLPDYPDGRVSPIYNCGPGLAVDKETVTGEDSRLVVISSTGEASFNAYVDRLVLKGFSILARNQIEGNIHYSLESKNQRYYMYYTSYSNQVRIIEENTTNAYFSDLDSPAGAGTTEFYHYSIDYTHGEGQTTKADYWQIDCGALIIIKLADNSLFVIDGGHERQSSNAALDGLMDFMYQITGQEPGSKINIKSWFFSHAHGDHVYLTHAFVEKYHDRLDIESVMYNIPSYQTMSSGYDGGTFLMKATLSSYYPDCLQYKLHTGESFSLQGVEFDVLFTHEDAVNDNGKNNISNFNDTSTVIKVTIDGKSFMLLGDAYSYIQSEMLRMYSAGFLKSDAVQTGHHGYNNLTSLYNAIAAPIVLFSNSEANAGAESGNTEKYNGAMNAAPGSVALFADPYTYKIVVENDEIKYSTLPSYREGLYFDIPELSESLVPNSTEPGADLDEVLAKNSLLDYVIDKSINGTLAESINEPCSRILDGKTDTKFCTKTTPAVIAWQMKEAVTLDSYVIYTANDNSKNPGRNPQKWVLCGSNDAQNWTVIDAVSNAGLPDTDYTGVAFNVDEPAAYKYYVLKMFSTAGANVLQFSEIGLYSDSNPEPDPEPTLGDIDGNGSVNVSDVVALRQLIMNQTCTETQLKAGDMDGNGTLTVSDVVALRQLIMAQPVG